MSSVIYVIVNIVNDKHYVGQAYVKHNRWKNHRAALNNNYHNNRYLQSAWNKYGAENFVFVVLENVPSYDMLTVREQWWIDILNSADREHGYNISPAAGSCLGLKHTNETKAKWSAQRKGQKRSAEFAESVRVRMTGKVITEETRERLRQAHIGETRSDSFKQQLSERMKGNQFVAGRKQTEEEIERRRLKNTGKKRSEETKARMSEAQRNRHHNISEEIRRKMSESAKNRKDRLDKNLNILSIWR